MIPTVHGSGLGFRRELLDELYANDLSKIDFFEIAPENWLDLGGKYEQHLRYFTDRFQFTCHGLSLSLGGTDPLNESLLKNTKKLMDAHNIELYTEHLSWCAHEGQLYDLLPIPFTQEAVRWVAERVKKAQDILERPIGIENSSYYLVPPNADLTEIEFINGVLTEANCFLHLDVNNLYVNSQNLKYNPGEFLNALQPDKVGYLHMAGHYVEQDGWIVDTHGANVIEPVWDLLKTTYAWLGSRAETVGTCLERDFNFPKFAQLISEVERIKTLQNESQINAKTAAQ